MADEQTYVEAARASELTTERLIDILRAKLGDRLDSVYDRYTIQGADGDDMVMSEGDIYLPTPQTFIRQPAPSAPEGMAPGAPVIYVGQDGRPSFDSFENAHQHEGRDGASRFATVPFACRIYFSDAPQQADAPSGDRQLDVSEVMNRRATRYVGAMRSVLEEYGCPGTDLSKPRHRAIQNLTPSTAFQASMVMSTGEESSEVGGGGVFEFDIEQYQWVPHHSKL
jgi:hypothetical protein